MSAHPAGDHVGLERRLGAYVDGELPASDAAEIAALMTRDPVVARRVAALTRLKAELRAGVGTAPAVALPGRRRPALRRRALGLAAAVLLVAVVGVGWAFMRGVPGSGPPGAWERHDVWVAQSGADAADAATAPLADTAGSFLRTRLPQASHDLYLPDLSAARLTLAHAEFVSDADGRAMLHAGYVGSRGCRVSLFIFAGPASAAGDGSATPDAIAEAVAAAGATAAEALAWRNGMLHYLVLARGMDPAHFATVSETVRRLTIEQQPPDAATVLLLADSRARAEPCRA